MAPSRDSLKSRLEAATRLFADTSESLRAPVQSEAVEIVPRYMLLLGGADLDKRSANTALARTMLEQYSAWVQSLAQAGRLRETYKLDDRVGARLNVRGGEVLEGPFIETKDAIGGIFIIEADSLEEAT